MSAPLLDRVRAEGPSASIPEPGRETPDAAAVVARLRGALDARRADPVRALSLWDEAGRRHDPGSLDAALATLTAGGWVPFAGAASRKRLREGARDALARTAEPGTVELAAAVLGAAGTEEDADALEALARHPAFTLHAATALSNLAHWRGRAALLRLLSATDGASRVVVIDRLLAHVREPAVRLALVRDALRGLDPESAREVAGAIAESCAVRECLDDPAAPEDLKAGARLVLAAAG